MSEISNKKPLTYNFAVWYGIVLSVIYLIYGGVKIILSFLDNNYTDMGSLIFFALLGLVLLSIAIAFKERKSWSYYGMVGLVSMVALSTIYNLIQGSNDSLLLIENIFILLVTAVALYTLIAAPTREYFNKSS